MTASRTAGKTDGAAFCVLEAKLCHIDAGTADSVNTAEFFQRGVSEDKTAEGVIERPDRAEIAVITGKIQEYYCCKSAS